jgi:hypothetical protein
MNEYDKRNNLYINRLQYYVEYVYKAICERPSRGDHLRGHLRRGFDE